MKKNIRANFYLILAICTFYSCEEQNIDSVPLDFGDVATVYGDSTRVQQFVNYIYNYVPDGFGRIGNAFVAGATDEGVFSTNGSSVSKWAMGAWGPTFLPDNPLSNSYTGIRATYVYENQIHPHIIDGVMTSVGRELNMGQIYFLRALFNFEIISRFGGYPIVLKELNASENISIPRSTYDECVRYIEDLCDKAIERLPVSVSAANLGQATKGAAMALKSRLLLYAASPLFNDPSNPSDDLMHGAYTEEKWKKSAETSAKVINLKNSQGNTLYKLSNNRYNLFLSISDPEIIFNKLSAPSNALERLNAPVGLQNGRGGTCPTLDLVDAYPMKNGTTFDWNNTTMSKEPFANRDPRFENDILYNGAKYIGNYEIATYEGGVDRQGIYATKTSFYLRKFMSNDVNWWGTQALTNHSFILFRHAEILLNYAEAMNEAYGPDNDPENYGMTARQAVKMIRDRAGLTGNNDLSITVAAGNKSQMRDAIRTERQVELAFEEHRGFDLRRWKIAEQVLNRPVQGLRITQNADGSFTYDKVNVENRVFLPKMYYYPFPQSEINRNGELVQNKGWN